jgi:hypothetical protein
VAAKPAQTKTREKATATATTTIMTTAKGKERHGKDGKSEKNERFFAALRMTA